MQHILILLTQVFEQETVFLKQLFGSQNSKSRLTNYFLRDSALPAKLSRVPAVQSRYS